MITNPVTETKTALRVIGTVGDKKIEVPDLSEESAAAQQAIELYEGYKNTIDCAEMKEVVASELLTIAGKRRELEKKKNAIIEPLKEARRQSLAAMTAAENLFAPILSYYTKAEGIISGEISRYERILESERLAEQRRLQEAAAAEQRRLQDEANERIRKAAEEDRAARAKAAELERQGKIEEAAQVTATSEVALENAAAEVIEIQEEAQRVVESTFVQSESVKLKGISMTGKWIAEVVDVKEVCAGIGAGDTPLDAIRIKVDGKLKDVPPNGIEGLAIGAIEISMKWFNERARREEKNFNYRGMRARYSDKLRY